MPNERTPNKPREQYRLRTRLIFTEALYGLPTLAARMVNQQKSAM
jgi:hypothetical protein